MKEKIRWGILGTGTIARAFTTALSTLEDAEVVAVGSRRRESAEAFGDEFDIPQRHASYEDLVSDPAPDIIYVATPHFFHHSHGLMILEAGKHVLIEKAFTINAAQAEEIIDLARRKNLFAMEAMWTRFFPATLRLRELLADNVIGEVQMVRADLSHSVAFDPSHRLYDPAQGGGALLDVGVYPISFASMVLGEPDNVMGVSHFAQTGVDDRAACLLSYQSGAIAVLSFSQTGDAPREALISGSEGFIRLPGRWHQPAQIIVSTNGVEEVLDLPFQGNGYQFEASAAMDCIRAGLLQSELMPLNETLTIMRTMDRLRAHWGLRYPGE